MCAKNCVLAFGMFIVGVLAAGNIGCGGGTATVSQPVSVSLSTASATVLAGATAQFTATVANDASNTGVTWTLTQGAKFCSPGCGTVVPGHTGSGVATTYTAPTAPPASDLKLILTATSMTDVTKSAPATITVPAIAVSISPASANLAAGMTAQFTGTVSNDHSNSGVTWTLTQNSAPCSPGCGTVAPTSTPSGNLTTYTAPATAPASTTTVTLTATSLADTTKSVAAIITNNAITIPITPSSASVPSGGTQQFAATVVNGPSNATVNWSLIEAVYNFFTHRIYYFACSNVCGTISATSTASGAPITYTAPADFTHSFLFHGVFLQASSNGVGSRAPITILPISVSVSPSQASVVLNATRQFMATVTNDGTNSGVTWTLTQNGAACSPGCGTIAPTSTASGAALTYTAPVHAPALPMATLTATSVEDPKKIGSAVVTLTTSTGGLACGSGSGNESLLKGQYAFLLSGSDSNGQTYLGGSITADGTGKITGGEEDIQRLNSSGGPFTINATGSSYAVGADHRGCLLLTNANGETTFFRFALGSINASSVSTSGHMVQFGDTTSGTFTAGTIRLQDANSFTASQFNGNYVMGFVGSEFDGTRVAIAGTFASDGVSTVPSGTFDFDNAGRVISDQSAAPEGTFTCCDANGRGTLTLQIDNLAFYMISSADALLISTDESPIGGGEAIGAPSATTFSQGSLNGASVLRQTGQSSTGPVVDIATVGANGTGAITTDDNINSAGSFTTSSTALNYTVASNGRVAISGNGTPPVLYLFGPNQGFLVGTDSDTTFGILEPQATGPFSDASFSGAYTLGTENPSASTVTLESGVVTANGSGKAAGTSDQSSSGILMQNQSLNLTYSISANGSGDVGSGTTAIMITGNKLVFISNTSTNPTITVVEK